jgi:integrase
MQLKSTHRIYTPSFGIQSLSLRGKSELTQLTRDAYNAFTNTVYIPDSKAGIPIHKPVPEEMKDYFLHGIPAGCPWLFWRQDKDGQYKPLGDFKKSFKTCVKAAGLVDVRVHDLRHVAASDLCAMGNSERAIMDIAGWKTPMLSTYWHKDSLRSAKTILFRGRCEDKCEDQKAAAL